MMKIGNMTALPSVYADYLTIRTRERTFPFQLTEPMVTDLGWC